MDDREHRDKPILRLLKTEHGMISLYPAFGGRCMVAGISNYCMVRIYLSQGILRITMLVLIQCLILPIILLTELC